MSEQNPFILEQATSLWKAISPWVTLLLTVLSAAIPFWLKRIEKKNRAALDKLKSRLDRRLHVHKLQFEKEQSVYQDVWGNLIDLRKAVSELRPVIDIGLSKVPEEEQRRERLKNLSTTAQCFLDQVNKERPFYAEGVYIILHELAELVRNESIDYDMGRPEDGPDYWKTRKENLNAIEEKTNVICEAIRERLDQVSGV